MLEYERATIFYVYTWTPYPMLGNHMYKKEIREKKKEKKKRKREREKGDVYVSSLLFRCFMGHICVYNC